MPFYNIDYCNETALGMCHVGPLNNEIFKAKVVPVGLMHCELYDNCRFRTKKVQFC